MDYYVPSITTVPSQQDQSHAYSYFILTPGKSPKHKGIAGTQFCCSTINSKHNQDKIVNNLHISNIYISLI